MNGYLRFALCAMAVGLLIAASAAAVDGRPMLSLDGPWQFRMDPDSAGEAEGWFAPETAFSDRIAVPGAWEAQGFGAETPKLRHHFIGKGWYKRRVTIPADWTGRRVFLCIGGVHRYARVWIDDAFIGEHIGYLSPFEYDISEHVRPTADGQDAQATVTICVDSEQRWDIDTIIGCFDIIDYMDTYWGGIWGHVTLEARSQAYLEDLFVVPAVSPPACRVSATLVGEAAPGDGVLLEVLDESGLEVVETRFPLEGPIAAAASIPNAVLWTPNAPYLYTAQLSLVRGEEVLDRVQARFGLREFSIQGTHVRLNGKRIFLHGYGDDCIYPETMAGPSDKDVYLERLQVAKEYGFNHVRHHSHLLPPEYYEACDEVGMLVSAEFPIGYQQFYERAKDAAMDLYKSEWRAVIKRFRNHPSIFDWCMGNEMWKGVELSPELYTIAKELDPTRPVVDSDGLFTGGFIDGTADRDTLDFYFVMFDIWNTPLDVPNKFHCPAPLKPVISHETGNYVTFPRLDQIELFTHNFKPFWLEETRSKMERAGLLDEASRWADNSEELYYLCHKLNLEALRKSPNLSGHHWWLLQDYWTTSNGLVDTYRRPKPTIAPERVRQFNADTVLLQDGLALTYRSGEHIEAALLVSNYAETRIDQPALTWRVLAGDALVAENSVSANPVGQGELVELTRIAVAAPDTAEPVCMRLEAVLMTGDGEVVNDWTTWVYPAGEPRVDAAYPIYADVGALPMTQWCGAQPLPDDASLPAEAVYVAAFLTDAMVDATARGASLVLLRPEAFLPCATTRFKTAWWLGNERDNNAGTVVYDNPVTRAMAPDGWCDAHWYRLIEGCEGYLLDGLPAKPEVLIRGIEVASVCRDKALLMQAGVGEGAVIVCGLNVEAPQDHPEKAWFVARLIEYAASRPTPEARLPEAYLHERAAEMPKIIGPFVEGFARVTRNQAEEANWFTYREPDAKQYTCRQTQPGNLIEWETAAVPADLATEAVTFVFAGGLGWKSQPKTDGFALAVNGEDVLDLDVADALTTWADEARSVALTFIPKRVTNEDAAGLFYVRVPAAVLTSGAPCRLAVRSKGSGSQRWFALHPYTDVLGQAAP
ncbi:MAG TPA: glycoside hydrolase family 2 TIM barrel-domain containing protein [Candidatus Hydrogenedentes bacterium]|nr:glycoside hydrolase family 2 TIM barrel-domain containing protein [Candidatus Hydrogenedentota bacterium]HPG69288.1 glycoside hydrolase family 2 TIM barrel-domain containing protein [Candidatus Hydrogenedentota bacterium]